MDLQVSVRKSGDVTILDIAGRATMGPGNDLLRSQLERAVQGGSRKVLLNLTDLLQVDSSGLATLVKTFVSLGRMGGSLKLLGPSARVLEVLEVMRLPQSIPTFQNEATALSSFQ